MVEAHAEGVEAIRRCGSFVIDRTQTEEHALVHQDHTTLQRIEQNLMVLVAGRWRGVNGHLETEHLGVEGSRSLDVRDGHPDVVDGSYRQVRHGSSCDRESSNATWPNIRVGPTCLPSDRSCVRCGV